MKRRIKIRDTRTPPQFETTKEPDVHNDHQLTELQNARLHVNTGRQPHKYNCTGEQRDWSRATSYVILFFSGATMSQPSGLGDNFDHAQKRSIRRIRESSWSHLFFQQQLHSNNKFNFDRERIRCFSTLELRYTTIRFQ